MNFQRIRDVSLLFAACMIMSVAPAGASDSPRVPFTAETAGDGIAAASVEYSPAGCFVQANNPHKSTSAGTYGDIKGYSFSQCDVLVSYLAVKSTVWRKRWWGYQQMGEAGYGNGSWINYIGRSGHWDGCENNTWRTVGNGHSKEGGKDYYAEVMKYAAVNNC